MPADSTMDKSFEHLSRSIMDELLSWDPGYATQVGWHKYDWRLRDPSSREAARQVDRCDELISTLERLGGSGLTPDELLDRDLAIYLLRLKRFEIGELKLNQREFASFSDIGHSLFLLSARDHPSFEQRAVAVIHRLEAVPEYLVQSREVLRNPYRTWIEANIETGAQLPDLMKEIEDRGASDLQDRSTLERLRSAVARASRAVGDYNEWLAKEVLPRASEIHSISPEEYTKYFQIKDFGMTDEQALEVGEAYLRDVKRRMGEVAKQICSSGDVAEALEKMKSDRPATFSEALKAYESSCTKAREFLTHSDLLTIPDAEKLLVLETPRFMRPMTPFAAQYEPGKFDGSRTGMFLVTPDDDNPEYLREHSYPSIVNTTVHEGYPGHHIQGLCSNTNPSYIRVLTASPDFSEGWGLYCEDVMISEGYNDSPMGRLTNLNDLLLRIVRLIVEINLAKGRISPEEGARMLIEECAMDANAARIEARSCSMGPTYYASYFLGKLAIMQLRHELREAMGDKFSLKFFHDALLYAGCMPMAFMRRALATRLRKEYGIELGDRKDSLYRYAMKKISSAP